jgi:hypothetical protein
MVWATFWAIVLETHPVALVDGKGGMHTQRLNVGKEQFSGKNLFIYLFLLSKVRKVNSDGQKLLSHYAVPPAR